MLTANYHTHTKRCGHAVGEDEEYVLNAIKAGIKVLGFSDHAPFPEEDPRMRMSLTMLDDYIRSVHDLKEKYKDRITIYCGIELEYFADEWETLTMLRETMDYCILGQHSHTVLGKKNHQVQTADELWTYVNDIEAACEHHLCDYIAHPDYCMWSWPRIDADVCRAAELIADISLKYDIPLELNCGSGVSRDVREYPDGYRYGYPTRVFFEEFARRQCRIVIGLDAHNPDFLLTDKYLNRALSVCYGLDINFDTDFNPAAAAVYNKTQFH